MADKPVAGLKHLVERMDTTDVDAAVGAVRRRDRKKGSRREARSVRRVRSAWATLLETNAIEFQDLFNKAKEKDPLKTLALMVSITEYYMPKLGRIEQTGTVEHKVSHFVPLIAREEPPAGYLGGKEGSTIEGEATEVAK